MTNSKVNLLGLSRKMLRDYLLSIGEKPFRGDQIMKPEFSFSPFLN